MIVYNKTYKLLPFEDDENKFLKHMINNQSSDSFLKLLKQKSTQI
jgi:hypothetical protein